jgi:hypothetical protein
MPSLINSDDGVVSGSAGLKTTGSNDGILALQNNGTTNVTVTAAGNVGIGTSSPQARLHSSGAIQTGVTGTDGSFNLARATDGAVAASVSWNPTTTALQLNNGVGTGNMTFLTNSTERARITAAGDFQYNNGYGSVATAYGCRAWVSFNGTGAVAIRASGNVSSITDNNTGDYTVNFTTAMTDTNYTVTGTCFSTATGTSRGFISHSSNVAYSPATGSMRFCSIAAGVGNTDYQYEYIAIFR